jgi:hypothetical protein
VGVEGAIAEIEESLDEWEEELYEIVLDPQGLPYFVKASDLEDLEFEEF